MSRANPARTRRLRDLLPEQRGRCKWCGGDAKPPRLFWCSDRCVQAWKALDPEQLRQACWERDRGFCRLCHRDIAVLEKRLRAALGLGSDHLDAHGRARAERRGKRWEYFLARVRVSVQRLWEADHTIPVIEGGPNCLANLRTLCVPCHKRVTAELRGRLAAKKRAARLLSNAEAAA